MERVHQAQYQVPDDNMDEDLAQVPEDYSQSNKTKKFCQMKVMELSADLNWEDTEDALCEASLNHIHRFLNWYLKLEYSPNGRR
ncbi:hypothetical protein N7488_008939 [Penicillium malachiteum]|nr:hypothetical protein N7488_008939 [Penicillium malachiteum]